MEIWRLLDIEYRDPYRNMAVDEVLLIAVERSAAPNTVRFWRNPNAVVIGRSQSLEAEVNLEACEKLGTPVVRRFTGGGTVYQDHGNLNWTIVARRNHALSRAGGVLGIFEEFSSPILEGIKILRTQAEFRPPNGIFIGEKKISGMAAYVKKGSILCHGTLLVSTNLGVLTSVLKLLKTEVTTLQQESGARISMASAKKAIAAGFGMVYGQVRRGKLSGEEIELIRLCEKKYAAKEWNLRGELREQNSDRVPRRPSPRVSLRGE